MLHFDTKGLRTLPLLVARSGLLTRRYIEGQRTQYVSPLALFLFCAFPMYFVLSIVGEYEFEHANVVVANVSTAKSDMAKAEADVDTELANAKAALQAAQQKGGGVQEAQANPAGIADRREYTGCAMCDGHSPCSHVRAIARDLSTRRFLLSLAPVRLAGRLWDRIHTIHSFDFAGDGPLNPN